MSKDRERIIELATDVEIVYLTSSTHPTEYAIVMRVMRDGEWVAVISADNSHEEHHVDVHHMHRYSHGKKLKAEQLPFPVVHTNDAMYKVIDWMADNWEDLTR